MCANYRINNTTTLICLMYKGAIAFSSFWENGSLQYCKANIEECYRLTKAASTIRKVGNIADE